MLVLLRLTGTMKCVESDSPRNGTSARKSFREVQVENRDLQRQSIHARSSSGAFWATAEPLLTILRLCFVPLLFAYTVLEPRDANCCITAFTGGQGRQQHRRCGTHGLPSSGQATVNAFDPLSLRLI